MHVFAVDLSCHVGKHMGDVGICIPIGSARIRGEFDRTGLNRPIYIITTGARFDYFTDRFRERTKRTNG